MTAAKACPRCDEPLEGAEAACPRCKKPLGAAAGLASAPAKALSCPVCKIPAYPSQLDGQEALHCAECEGLGLTRKAMMKLQPQGKKELLKGAEERGHKTPPFFEPRKKPPFLICPFCAKRMKLQKFGKIEVDQCEACDAIWLDGPKFPQLAEFIGPYKWRIAKG